MSSLIPIIIPAYEPDGRFIDFLGEIEKTDLGPIIVVDDGSGSEYEDVFKKAQEKLDVIGGHILVHEVNKGKGRALKTAFEYVLETYPDAIGVVTADSDGQHTTSCVKSVLDALVQKPDNLILGVRDFDMEGIPWKSVFGNKLTMKVMQYVAGISVSDTQTGLRGIPREFMKRLLDVRGERFEFETEMLLDSYGKFPIYEVKIETIYDSKENHQTHFNPVVDSIKIYKILGRKFFTFIFASLSSCILDLALFALFCYLLKGNSALPYITVSTVLARIISAGYNFAINYKKVFASSESVSKSAAKYAILAVIQMSLSSLFVTIFVGLIPRCPEVVIKAVVDTLLFFASYKIQQKFVFSKIGGKK